MKKIIFILFIISAFSVHAQKLFETNGLKVSIGPQGGIVSFYGDREYLPPGVESTSFVLRLKGKNYNP